MPLYLGMVEPERRPAALDHLVRDVRQRGNAVTSGDIGYRYLLQALAGGGRSDVIFDMASRTDTPSYGYQLKKGATALAEAWDANPKLSQNHCMLGHIEEWFYRSLAGIDAAPDAVAFDKIVIRPQVVGDIRWAEGRYRSPRGEIVSRWRIENGKFLLRVKIPVGSTAVVYVPGAAPVEVGSGEHEFAH